MDDRREPAAVEVDLDELGTGSGAPEAVTEQPDLSFEHSREARWIGDVMGMRLAAVALARRARRRRGEDVLPLPWVPIALAALAAGGVVATIGWVLRQLAG